MPTLDLLTRDELEAVVREVLREEFSAFAEALLAKLRQKPVIKSRRAAAAYLELKIEDFKRAEELGFFRPLPWKHNNANLYDVEELERDFRAFAELLGRNGDLPESKAAAGVEAPARKE